MNIGQHILNSIEKNHAHNAFCIDDVYYSYEDFSKYISNIQIAIQTNIKDNEFNIGLITNNDLDNKQANKTIVDNIKIWQLKAELNYGVVEYYNYSIYSGLTLTDHLNFNENYEFLKVINSNLFRFYIVVNSKYRILWKFTITNLYLY